MKLPSFEEFAAVTEADELSEVIKDNLKEIFQASGVELSERETAIVTATIGCCLSNSVTLLAAYHEWLSSQL